MDEDRNLKTLRTDIGNLTSSIPFWHQLRWSLVLYLVVLTTVILTIVITINFVRTAQQARSQVTHQLESIAELKIAEITRWLYGSQAVLTLLLTDTARSDQFVTLATATLQSAQNPAVSNVTLDNEEQDGLNNLLKDAVSAQPFFEEFFLYNADGRIVAASDLSRIDQLTKNQPYFADSLVEDFIQSPYYELGRNELTMLITHPLQDEQSGQTVAVLAGRLNLRTLGQIMTERTGLGNTGETYLISPENNYLVTPSRFEEEGYTLTRAYKSEGIERALRGENGSDLYRNYQEPAVPVIGVYRWLPELNVGMLAEAAEAEALAPFFAVRNFSFGVAAVVILVAFVIGFYSAARISQPIISLTQVATQIARGDLEQQASVSQRNEIGLLAATFNYMTLQLRQTLTGLEIHNQRMGIIAGLSERLSALLTLEELLAEAVNQVTEKFDYYHAHIYLLDAKQEKLVVAEGTGLAGAEMKAKGHSIPLNASTSLVARAVRTGQIVHVDNVHEVADWLPNPLLPNTCSEMAVPIILEGKGVGVLDVQQDRIAGLDDTDANQMRFLANQVAVAIRNAGLFNEIETALAEAQIAQARYVEQAWDKTRITQQNKGHVQYSLDTSFVLDEDVIAQARQQAFTKEGPTPISLNDHQEPGANNHDEASAQYALIAPIKLRNVVVGNLQLHTNELDRSWTEDELALVNAIIDQVAQAAENLRLFEETRERAARERLISQIGDKFRRAPDLETLMKLGVEEIARILRPDSTFVRLGSEAELVGPEPAKADVPQEEETQSEVTMLTTDTKLDSARNGHGDM